MKTYRKYLLPFLLLLVLPVTPLWATDLTLTAGSVVADDGFAFVDGIAGETVLAGQVVYLKASDSRYWKAHCETSAATAAAVGILLNGASAGQPVRVMTSGSITIGATVGTGTIYILSTAGLICPVTDLATADYVTVLGVATSTTKILLRITVSNTIKAAYGGQIWTHELAITTRKTCITTSCALAA